MITQNNNNNNINIKKLLLRIIKHLHSDRNIATRQKDTSISLYLHNIYTEGRKEGRK